MLCTLKRHRQHFQCPNHTTIDSRNRRRKMRRKRKERMQAHNKPRTKKNIKKNNSRARKNKQIPYPFQNVLKLMQNVCNIFNEYGDKHPVSPTNSGSLFRCCIKNATRASMYEMKRLHLANIRRDKKTVQISRHPFLDLSPKLCK